jgi:toxin ParE1/3/4
VSRAYVLDPAAVADLRDVARYTTKQWGAAQTRVYTAKLHEGMVALASGQGHYRELPEVHAGLRMTRCQHHYLFMLSRPGAPAVVLAVLHERMDLMERLKARFGV